MYRGSSYIRSRSTAAHHLFSYVSESHMLVKMGSKILSQRCHTYIIATLFVIFYFLPHVINQIIVIPDQQVVEPFKNNPIWEDFKTAQFDRINVLETLVSNVWSFLDTIDGRELEKARNAFIKYHVTAFQGFFKESEKRLQEGNPYAILDPAIGIHTVETLFHLSSFSPDQLLDKLRVKWMEVDAMALRIHVLYNETTEKLLHKTGRAEEVISIKQAKFPTWISQVSGGVQNGTMESWTLDNIAEKVDALMDDMGSKNHLIRGLVKLLSTMTQLNVDYKTRLNYYCYGNNEFGVFQDIYNVITDAALYLCLMDMKKLVLDTLQIAFSKLYSTGTVKDTPAIREQVFQDMVERIKKKIGFEYLDGSDYSDLPHPPIFKCDKPPLESDGKVSQWGKSRITGISPKAGPTHPFDPQAGPEKEDGNVGYIDDRTGQHEYVYFEKAYHGYIESELVLNPEAMCKGTCRDYKRVTKTCEGNDIACDFLRSTHCDSSDPDCMKRNKCPQYARNCVRTSQSVQMCSSDDPTRYYSHINLPPYRTFGLGENGTGTNPCEGETSTARERWEMEFGLIVTSPQYCELCMCTCMTPQDLSEMHFVSLEPMLSDARKGFIVSAIKFYQEDHVLYMMVEQGKPIPRGEISQQSLSWVPVKPADKSSPKSAIPLGINGFLRMHFDIVVGNPDEVVTGVRFSVKDQSLFLEVQVSPLSWSEPNPSEITIDHANSRWISVVERESSRKGLAFHRPGVPAKQRGPSMPDVVYNSYVEFTTTDYEEDAGQSTIPFFDTQPVHHYETRRWLQGLGVMHKGKSGSGGFISPMVIPIKGPRITKK